MNILTLDFDFEIRSLRSLPRQDVTQRNPEDPQRRPALHGQRPVLRQPRQRRQRRVGLKGLGRAQGGIKSLGDDGEMMVKSGEIWMNVGEWGAFSVGFWLSWF
jgi:hypothetical protein